jgi:diadenosine tetraphosphate (Ap4A) HIT family hydrolase
MSAPFVLDARLAADSLLVGNFPSAELRLMNQSAVPWLLLVPTQPNLRELTDLSPESYASFMQILRLTAECLQILTQADKLNIGALGNQVPQLHVHIIARFTNDPAWPNPVWGALPPSPYAPQKCMAFIRAMQKLLAKSESFVFISG